MASLTQRLQDLNVAIKDYIDNAPAGLTLAQVNTAIDAKIVTALEGEDLSDIAAAIAANAAAQTDLVTLTVHNALAAVVANKANSSDHYTKAEIGNPDFDLAAHFNGL